MNIVENGRCNPLADFDHSRVIFKDFPDLTESVKYSDFVSMVTIWKICRYSFSSLISPEPLKCQHFIRLEKCEPPFCTNPFQAITRLCRVVAVVVSVVGATVSLSMYHLVAVLCQCSTTVLSGYFCWCTSKPNPSGYKHVYYEQ